jgi:hypothetical protein
MLLKDKVPKGKEVAGLITYAEIGLTFFVLVVSCIWASVNYFR